MSYALQVKTPSWVSEFRAFIARGSVVDLAMEAEPADPIPTEKLRIEIRDELKARP